MKFILIILLIGTNVSGDGGVSKAEAWGTYDDFGSCKMAALRERTEITKLLDKKEWMTKDGKVRWVSVITMCAKDAAGMEI